MRIRANVCARMCAETNYTEHKKRACGIWKTGSFFVCFPGIENRKNGGGNFIAARALQGAAKRKKSGHSAKKACETKILCKKNLKNSSQKTDQTLDRKRPLWYYKFAQDRKARLFSQNLESIPNQKNEFLRKGKSGKIRKKKVRNGWISSERIS